MSKKWLKRDASTGRVTEEEAVVTQVANSVVATDGTGRIPEALMPVGIGADTVDVLASESLSAGDLVNFWDDAGTVKARKADASTSGKQADGFVVSSATSGDTTSVYLEGSITGLSALTLGSRQYLSDVTPGKTVETPVSGTGKVHQYVGRAVSATQIAFEATDSIVLV